MNQRTAKMLHRYATQEGKSPKDVKKWWMSLNAEERTKERKRIMQGSEA